MVIINFINVMLPACVFSHAVIESGSLYNVVYF